MNKKIIFSISCNLIGSHLLFANFSAKLLNFQPGPRENVVVYYPIPYSSGYFSLYRQEPIDNKNIAVIAHGHDADTLLRNFQNIIRSASTNHSCSEKPKTNPYYFALPQLNHLFRLYAKDLKKSDGSPQYDIILGYGYSSVGHIKELGQRMSDTLVPITSRANKVVHNAHSMGGLVSLWALTKTGSNGFGGRGKAQTLITYSSPLQGIATNFPIGSITSLLNEDISTTDMMTMTPYPDDFGKSELLRELNDGSRGFKTNATSFFDEVLDGYCISGSRYANLTGNAPPIGEDPSDAIHHIGKWSENLKEAINTPNFFDKVIGMLNVSYDFYKNTSSGLNIQKGFDFLTKDYWTNDQWDFLSDAEAENASNWRMRGQLSNRRMGRLLSDGLVPLYSGTSFPKMWCPNNKKYEDMTQAERAIYIDAMAQKSKSFREDRSNHTFILHLNHRTILGSHDHWDGNYNTAKITTILDQKGNSDYVQDPQWLLYKTLQKINEEIAKKDSANGTLTVGS